MAHFLVQFDRLTGEVSVRGYHGADSGRRAMEARFAAESSRRSRSVEVVVLQADTEDELHRTHSRYFESLSELAKAAIG